MATRNLTSAAAVLNTQSGAPKYLGTIVATTVTTNATTASAFTIPAGATLAIIPDAACYFSVEAATCTAANGFPLAADDVWLLTLGNDQSVLQVLSASGTCNCKVFQLI